MLGYACGLENSVFLNKDSYFAVHSRRYFSTILFQQVDGVWDNSLLAEYLRIRICGTREVSI